MSTHAGSALWLRKTSDLTLPLGSKIREREKNYRTHSEIQTSGAYQINLFFILSIVGFLFYGLINGTDFYYVALLNLKNSDPYRDEFRFCVHTNMTFKWQS